VATAAAILLVLGRYGSPGAASDDVIAAIAVLIVAFIFWFGELTLNFVRAKVRIREAEIARLDARLASVDSERGKLSARIATLEAAPSVSLQPLNPEPLPNSLLKLAIKVTNTGGTGVFEARGFNATGLIEASYDPGSLAWEGKPEAKCEIPGGWHHHLWVATVDFGRRRLRFRGPASSYSPPGQQTNGMEVQPHANTVRFTLEIREVAHRTTHRESAAIEFSGISDYATLQLSPVPD
jgi:hypothetical protein